MALTKIDDRGLKTPIDLLDNEKIRLGTGNDLELVHNGTYSLIKDATKIAISSAEVQITDAAVQTIGAKFVEDAQVELYYNGSKKLETITSGLRVHGTNVYIGDSGENLRLHHNNNDTYIDSRVGNLHLRTTPSGVVALKAISNGALELYHANVKKAETVSGGFTVTGVCTATSFAGDGSNLTGISSVGGSTGVDFNDNVKARFGTGNDLSIYHDGTYNYILSPNAHTLILESDDLRLRSVNNENYVRGVANNQVEIYFDGSKKFETTAKGAYINDNYFGINVYQPTGTPDGRNAFLALGDSDTGMAQNGDGQLEAWANNQEIMNFSTGSITAYKHIEPSSNNSLNLGSTGNRWANVYVNDFHLSNLGHSNDVDGTWGDWTIQEGESDLFLKNNRSGKQYKFNLTEVS